MFPLSYYAVSATLSFLFWTWFLSPLWALGIVSLSVLATLYHVRASRLQRIRHASERISALTEYRP